MPSTLGIVASGLATPLDLSPSLWLDAADTSTITASGSPAKVSQWTDKSVNAYAFVQSTGASQPTTGSRTVNGLNGLDFASNRLTRAATSVVSSTDGTFSAFAVVVTDTTSGFHGVLNADEGTGARPPQFLRQNGTTLDSVRIGAFSGGNGVITASKSSAFSSGTPVLLRSVLTTGTYQVAVNGSTGTSETATGGATAGTSTHEVGDLFNTYRWDGIICEIIVYPRALSASEIASVETYLNAKWAVY